MRKTLLAAALLSAGVLLPGAASAEEAAALESPHSVSYNVGLFSQYIFRGLTQTGEEMALQGGVDYAHASGFYAGAWASNISWLEDGNYYDNSSLELDLYGGFASTIGETGIGYNVGVLQYIYPGDELPGVKEAETTEIYGALSYGWLQGKLSVVASDGAFGFDDADGSWYAELNANIPFGESGYTANLHVGRQEFEGSGNDAFDYTDWKIGLSKAFGNGVNVGGFYTDTDADSDVWTDASGQDLGDSQFTVFVQKVF